MSAYIVEVWRDTVGDIASNRHIGPFRTKLNAWNYAENVRHAFGEDLDARVLELESAHDDDTWRILEERAV